MATPIEFPEANLVLHGPAGPDDPDVHSLHARRLEGQVVSCWQLSAEDIEEINASGGKVWLAIWGHTMPPTLITGRKADVI